jgi:hypothetical protein
LDTISLFISLAFYEEFSHLKHTDTYLLRNLTGSLHLPKSKEKLYFLPTSKISEYNLAYTVAG